MHAHLFYGSAVQYVSLMQQGVYMYTNKMLNYKIMFGNVFDDDNDGAEMLSYGFSDDIQTPIYNYDFRLSE